MNWYQGEDKPKSVREIIIDVPSPKAVDPKFGMMFLGEKYHILRTNIWVTGYFRMDNEKGPFLLLRADDYTEKLKNQPFRVAHCFYRMKTGGLYAIFIDFPKLKILDVPSSPFVMFEMIRGIDMKDERERIYDGINRSNLHICFAEGDGPGEEFDGMWSGGSINAAYDVIIKIDEDCHKALNQEWKSLMNYHKSLSSRTRNFDKSVQQMQNENPISRNPIIKKKESKHEETTIKDDNTEVSKKWWQFW